MSTMAPVRRRKAEQFAAAHYTQMWSGTAAYVRRKLRRTMWHLPEPELEHGYNLAWCALMNALIAGKQPDSVQAWLNVVTYRRVLQYLTRPHVSRDVRLSEADSMPATSEDLCDIASDREHLRTLFEAIRDRCSDRDARILGYLLLAGLPRRDIAARMGLPLKRLSKILDGENGIRAEATRFLTLIATGGWCDAQKSLIAAHTLGWFVPGSPKDMAARAHLRTCRACRTRAW